MQPGETNPPLRFKKTRIAWSVFWGLACVLLIVLWVRSYWWADSLLHYRPTGLASIYLFTQPGGFLFETDYTPPFPFSLPVEYPGKPKPWAVYTSKYSEMDSPGPSFRSERPFSWYLKTCGDGMFVPFWAPVLAFGGMAVAPSRCWSKQFSLRSLLIATTLIGLLLGVVVYASR